VSSLRSVLIAIVTISAISLPVATQAAQGACAPKQHACGNVGSIAPCCCADRSDSSNPGGPIASRVQLTDDPAPIPVAFAGASVVDTSHDGVAVQLSPPRVCPVDFPTLYACLLI